MIREPKSNQICIKDNIITCFGPRELLEESSGLSFEYEHWKKKNLIINKILTIKYAHVSKLSMMNNGAFCEPCKIKDLLTF